MKIESFCLSMMEYMNINTRGVKIQFLSNKATSIKGQFTSRTENIERDMHIYGYDQNNTNTNKMTYVANVTSYMVANAKIVVLVSRDTSVVQPKRWKIERIFIWDNTPFELLKKVLEKYSFDNEENAE